MDKETYERMKAECTKTLDVGKVFEDPEKWMELIVRKNGGITTVTASPHNGTCYRLILTELEAEQQTDMLSDRWVVHLMFSQKPRRTWMTWPVLYDIDPEEIQICLGVGLSDAVCISVILARVFEMVDWKCDEFEIYQPYRD